MREAAETTKYHNFARIPEVMKDDRFGWSGCVPRVGVRNRQMESPWITLSEYPHLEWIFPVEIIDHGQDIRDGIGSGERDGKVIAIRDQWSPQPDLIGYMNEV